ncbi:hypothetical protein HETIRDRAFT_246047, partial [Heterobasidion irregulare TC 32-1]
ILLCEVVERSGRCSEVFDKSLVEVSKAKEGLYFFQVPQRWPGGDAIYFDWIHGYVICRDDEFEIFNSVHFKGAL